MLDIFNKKAADHGFPPIEEKGAKFNSGDIAFTKRDIEKVTVLGLAKKREHLSDNYVDFGTEYIIRGADNKARPIYEFELLTLEEACEKVDK
jgi:hypothetical protein